MGLGTGATAAIIGLGAAGSIAGSVINANAAGSAADKQVTADTAALDFQKQQWTTQQANMAPWLQAGTTSLGSIMQGFSNGTYGPGSIPAFKAPTAAEAAATPGEQFILSQGSKAITNAGSALGNTMSGGTLKALTDYGSNVGSTYYQQAYNNALSGYQAQLAGQTQSFNQLASIAGTGQTAATTLGNQGQAAATNVGTIMNNIGGAQAGGTLGTAQAISSGLGGASNSVMNGLTLSQYLKTNGIGAGGGSGGGGSSGGTSPMGAPA
jgi:hypothetical protein